MARTMRPRDPERTRATILAAAREEFAQFGPAGARVDRIAAAAGANKRMIYHYFGNKDGLWAALLADVRAEAAAAEPRSASDPWRRLVTDARQLASQPEAIRLLGWEALGDGANEAALDGTRAAAWQGRVAALRRAQRNGQINATLDPAQLELALTALQLFPHAFPQLTRMITGHTATDAAFIAAQSALFTALATWLTSSAAPPDAGHPVGEGSGRKPRLRRAGHVTRA